MHRSRDELLPYAGLAGNQHGALRGSDLAESIEEGLDSGRPADDSRGIRFPGSGLRPKLEQLCHSSAEDIWLDGLGEKIISAYVQGAHGAFDTPEPGNHQDRYAMSAKPKCLDERNTIDARHPEVDQHEVVV